MPEENYGATVARLRRERGWTQQELADAAGLPLRTIQSVENRQGPRGPHRATRLRIDAALEVEGDPVETRSQWPPDVRAMANLIGETLVALPEGKRQDVMTAITLQLLQYRIDAERDNP